MRETVLAFDVDGVLLQSRSSWAIIHDYFGVNNGNTLKQYLEKKISYDEFVRRDVSLWLEKRHIIHLDDFIEISRNVHPNPNYEYLSKFLDDFSGKKIAISGGVDVIVNRINDFFHLDEIYSNRLIFRDGVLVGGEAVVEPYSKGRILGKYEGRKISVGDSSWDKDMFINSDYSILFNSEEDLDFVDLKIKGNDLANLAKILNELL